MDKIHCENWMTMNLESKVLLNSKLNRTFSDNPGMYTSYPTGYEKFEKVNMKKKETLSLESAQVDFSVITIILITHAIQRPIYLIIK